VAGCFHAPAAGAAIRLHSPLSQFAKFRVGSFRSIQHFESKARPAAQVQRVADTKMIAANSSKMQIDARSTTVKVFTIRGILRTATSGNILAFTP
jgi:hypothetical protein